MQNKQPNKRPNNKQNIKSMERETQPKTSGNQLLMKGKLLYQDYPPPGRTKQVTAPVCQYVDKFLGNFTIKDLKE